MRLNVKIFLLLFLFSTFSVITPKLKAQSMSSFLKRKITEQLQRSYPPDEYQFSVEVAWLPVSIQNLDTTVVKSVSFQGVGLPRDYAMFDVVYREGDKTAHGKTQVHIRVRQKLPVALQRLDSNHEIMKRDLTWQWIDITRESNRFVSNPDRLAGRVVDHIINKGAPIGLNDVRQFPVVHAGDEVTLVYMNNGIRIVLQCVSRQPGAVDETIRLYSRETGKTYLGKILDKSQAEWEKTL